MQSTAAPLDPVAIKLGSLEIRWYGILIAIGMAMGYYLAVREGKRRGWPEDIFADLLLWAAPISILCARLYYVIFEWEYYAGNPTDIFKIWKGGLAIHGALIGAVGTAIVFCRVKKIPFWKLADISAPSLIIGQAIGRWGNFMNQEAHGGPVSREFLENLHLPDFIINQMDINGEYYHPTFLYESAWDVLGYFFLILLRRKNLLQGEIFLSYFIWYSAGRFFIEGLRTDSLYFFGTGIRTAQLVSILLITLSIVLIIYRRRLGSVPRYFDKGKRPGMKGKKR
jgi:prolipoprotein diacylglyceryl transferase